MSAAALIPFTMVTLALGTSMVVNVIRVVFPCPNGTVVPASWALASATAKSKRTTLQPSLRTSGMEPPRPGGSVAASQIIPRLAFQVNVKEFAAGKSFPGRRLEKNRRLAACDGADSREGSYRSAVLRHPKSLAKPGRKPPNQPPARLSAQSNLWTIAPD